MSSTPHRPLLLHESALSDEEFSDYPKRFTSLQHRGQVDVRELRGWLRGRHPDLDGRDMDSILKLFSTERIDESQFYAVLRLVNHAQRGDRVHPNLVFVQLPNNTPRNASHPLSRPEPVRTQVKSPGSNPFSQPSPSNSSGSDGGGAKSTHSHPPPPPHPRTHRPSNSIAHRPTESSSSTPRPTPLVPPPSNPFLARAKSMSSAPTQSNLPPSPGAPALPPRKPAPAPPGLAPTRSPLIKTSLNAAAAASQQKAAAEELARTRTVDVLARSPSLPPPRESSPPKLPRRRSPIASSVGSVDAIAQASLEGPFGSPVSPPSHTHRVGRSKSMHSPQGSESFLPPPRRRPESAQFSPTPASPTLSSADSRGPFYDAASISSAGSPGLARALSRQQQEESSPMSSLQRTFSALRPGFDSARSKTHSKLTRVGLLPVGKGEDTDRLVDTQDDIIARDDTPSPTDERWKAREYGREREKTLAAGWAPLS